MSIVSGLVSARDDLDSGAPPRGTPAIQGAGRTRQGGWLAQVFLGILRLYQLARAGRPSPCRFLPTCSQYASEAIERHGALHGGSLALRRIARCHPWGGQGIDQVPDAGGSR